MSHVLAFDTATEQLAVALGRRSGPGFDVVATFDERVPRAAMSHLLPVVRDLLTAEGLEPQALTAVFVGHGPGSFTGVRIGVATAKGLTRGLGVPLHGVGTLDAVASRVAGTDGLVGVVGDAMRGEVYPALFRCGGAVPERLGPDRVAHPTAVAAEWADLGQPVLLTGNGLAKYADVFLDALGGIATIAAEGLWAPSGASLLAAAAVIDAEQAVGDPGELLPVYTRLSDAEENERDRAGGAGATPSSGVAGPGGTS